MAGTVIFLGAAFAMGYFVGKSKAQVLHYTIPFGEIKLELPQMLSKAGIPATEDQLQSLNQVMCKEKIGFIK